MCTSSEDSPLLTQQIVQFQAFTILLAQRILLSTVEIMLSAVWFYGSNTTLGTISLIAGIIEMVLAGVTFVSHKYNWSVAPTAALTLCGVAVGTGLASIGSYSSQDMGWAIGLIATTFLSLVLTIIHVIAAETAKARLTAEAFEPPID